MDVRHHVFVKTGRDVQLAEVGPRFEMKRMSLRSFVDPWNHPIFVQHMKFDKAP